MTEENLPHDDQQPAEENPSNEGQELTPETPDRPDTPEIPTEEGGGHLDNAELKAFGDKVAAINREVQKVIIGQDHTIMLFLISLFTRSHILIEGVPGIAKTMLARMLARTVSSEFTRIQFTPDLMPTDIVGTAVFDMKESEFYFKPGPIFSNIILIDEINRSPAKTQAALFEVMEEYQVSVDGVTHPMEHPFMIVATQNPIEQEGTYKLPEAQLDRFLFRARVGYPSLEEEKLILRRFREDFQANVSDSVGAVLTPEDITRYGKLIEQVHIKDELIDYIAEIIHHTRYNGEIFLGASPRASLAILKAAKAFTAMQGRDFVIPEDIQFVIPAILNHRIVLTAEKEMEGVDVEDVISDIIKTVEVPR